MIHPLNNFKKYTFTVNRKQYNREQPGLHNNLLLVAEGWDLKQNPTTHHYEFTCLRSDAYRVEKIFKKFKIKIY